MGRKIDSQLLNIFSNILTEWVTPGGQRWESAAGSIDGQTGIPGTCGGLPPRGGFASLKADANSAFNSGNGVWSLTRTLPVGVQRVSRWASTKQASIAAPSETPSALTFPQPTRIDASTHPLACSEIFPMKKKHLALSSYR